MRSQQQPPLPGLEPLVADQLPAPPLWEHLPEADRLAALIFLARLINRMLRPAGGNHHD